MKRKTKAKKQHGRGLGIKREHGLAEGFSMAGESVCSGKKIQEGDVEESSGG